MLASSKIASTSWSTFHGQPCYPLNRQLMPRVGYKRLNPQNHIQLMLDQFRV